MNQMETENLITKIDFDELLHEVFQVPDIDVLTSYLIIVWKDLRQRSCDASLGINKHTFFSVI